MEKSDRLSAVSAALFFGALWGLAEATAGHAFHLLRFPGLAGFLMFPLGFLLMSRAYSRSGRLASVFMTSWVAASIKLVDLLIPGTDVMAVWNPVQAILLESLAATGLLYFLKTQRSQIPATERLLNLAPGPAFLSALSWRAAFAGLSLLWAVLFRAPNILQSGRVHLFRFLLIDSLVNGVLIFMLLKAFPISAFQKSVRFRLHPALTFACLAAALCIEAIL